MNTQTEKLNRSKVALVTVTYGERIGLLSKTVEAAIKLGVGKIFVVDNGSALTSSRGIQEMADRLNGVMVVKRLDFNAGSAKGFADALELAQADHDITHVWMMDDDNVPEVLALDVLLRSHAIIEKDNIGDPVFSLLSFRPDHQPKVAAGFSIAKSYPRANSFFGFHISDLPGKILRRFYKVKIARTTEGDGDLALSVPFAPYSGMFFSKNALSVVGLPNKDFVLYEDDTEFSMRFVNKGKGIYLIKAARIFDLEASWNTKNHARSSFETWLTAGSDFRVFYGVRNHAYLESRDVTENILVKKINKFIYLLILSLLAVKLGRVKRFHLFMRALADGERGLLGLHSQFPLPQSVE